MNVARTASTLVGVAVAIGALAAPAQAAETPPPGVGPMIIDGREAKDTQGAVRLLKEGKNRCTASIIAPEWVLTAKHCIEDVDDDDADEVSFKIGNVDLDEAEEVHAKEKGIHSNGDADLALVELEHPVETDYAHLGEKAVVGGMTMRTGHIYGWGATSNWFPGLWQSSVLKTANVVVRNDQCKDTYGGHALCAERWNGLSDGMAAKGDSGGPMFVKGMNGKQYQVGVLSTVDDRGQAAAEYTNVMEYEDWIEDVMDD